MRWWEYWSWDLFLTRVVIVLLALIAIVEACILGVLIFNFLTK